MLGSPQTRGAATPRLQLPGWEQSMFSWVRRTERASVVDPNANWQVSQAQAQAQVQEPEVRADLRTDILNDASGSVQPSSVCDDSLRLLSFNIQVGIKTTAYRQYLTKGWKHVLPHVDRAKNLQKIARLIADYDVVGLQEVDGGSLRSGFINQVEFLAQVAGFPYWYAQLNRDLGPIAQHGNGLLSRVLPKNLQDHKLPGVIPGRGAVFLRVPFAQQDLLVVMLHLSLGERSRQRQLAYISECVQGEPNVVLMGDMNTQAASLMEDSPLKHLNLAPADLTTPTYPAWRPRTAVDHILVSPTLQVRDYQVLDCQVSDHLPIAVEVAPNTPPLQ